MSYVLDLSELTLSDSNGHQTQIKHTSNKKKTIKKNEGWDPLGYEWSEKLASENFVVKNCLGDGNCQFRSIENAIQSRFTHSKLRRLVAKAVRNMSNAEFVQIIESYRLEKNAGEFTGGWDPYLIRTKADFIKEIKKSGFHFQGDDITLTLLSRALNVDFLIFMSNMAISFHGSKDHPKDKLVILYFDVDNKHYKTIGLRLPGKKNVHTVFEKQDLPSDVSIILDKHTLFTLYIRDICEKKQCMKLTYDEIMSAIEYKYKQKLSLHERKMCIKLIRVHLMNINYFRNL